MRGIEMGDEDPGDNSTLTGGAKLFFSGLIAPDGTRLSSFEDQARALMEKFTSIIEDLSCVISDVVHVTLYIKKGVNPEYLLSEYSDVIKGLPPAMTIIWVDNLPGQASYAMSLVAFLEG
ncbi:MAG: RidA family protein [Desulfurococcales archaeon]|nr:RidA family protein [Desulfurococcales archaeon]